MARAARTAWAALMIAALPSGAAVAQEHSKKTAPPVETTAATVETTLPTQGEDIRQLAYDGRHETFFASARPASDADHFTLAFERPVTVRSVVVTTGRPDGGGALAKGDLEYSEDGETFQKLAAFEGGKAHARNVKKLIQAIRIKPGKTEGPIAIGEIALVSNPIVPIFKYPVEFVLDVADAPDMKQWAELVARTCTRAYPMINEALASDGFQPARVIHLKLSKTYEGVAATSGHRIVGSVNFFRQRNHDVGAMVHETVHVVQAYHHGHNPGWLVEGVSDYVRFFLFEPGKLGPINHRTAHHDGSYRVTAAFLAYLTAKYDPTIVRTLNRAMREGQYDEKIFHQLTGKNLKELDEEWRETLRP